MSFSRLAGPKELPKSLDVSVFSAPMLLELLNVSATTGVAFTGTAATGHVVPKQLPQLLAKLETEVLRLAPKLSNEDFCRSALALARLGLGAEFLDAGDVEARASARPVERPTSKDQKRLKRLDFSPALTYFHHFHLST